VSFVWGTCYYRENIPRLNLAILGVVLMTGGVSSVGVVSSGQTLRSLLKPQDGADRRDRGLVSYTKLEEGKGSDVEEDEAGRGKGSGAGGALGAMSPRARGVLLAIYVGVANGSFMVPFKSAIQSSGLDAVEYVLSFGIGSAGITALVLALWLLLGEHRKPLGPSWRIALKPSLLTGLLWSGGNFCSIYATQLLDLTVAWPLVQCQLLVSTAWGIFYYHEVQGRQRIAMVVGSSLVVVVGVLFLSLSKAS